MLYDDDQLRAQDEPEQAARRAVLVAVVDDGETVVSGLLQEVDDYADVLAQTNANRRRAHDVHRLEAPLRPLDPPGEHRHSGHRDLRVVDPVIEQVARPLRADERDDQRERERDVAGGLDQDRRQTDRHPHHSAELSGGSDQSILADVNEGLKIEKNC